MSERTCEIDGKIFEGVPPNGDILCDGCAGHGNQNVCDQLEDCRYPTSSGW